MVWTEDKIKKLKKMWQVGKPTAEIAKTLGMSKNSIIGKVHRLNLKVRPSPIKADTTKTKTTPKKVIEKIGLMDLKLTTCRWPIGDPKDEDFCFCGKQTMTGKPYCQKHCQEAYVNSTTDIEKEKK